MSQRSSWWTSRFKEKKTELTTTGSNYFIWNRWSLFPWRMHTNTDLFVEYTSFLEKSMQKMEHEKGHLLNDDNNTWLKKIVTFSSNINSPWYIYKRKYNRSHFEKKIEFIPVMFIHDKFLEYTCIPEFIYNDIDNNSC